MKLASRIADDLEAQLAGNSIPFPLTMDGISNHYGVSYTPIREALSGLIENGSVAYTVVIADPIHGKGKRY